MLIFNPKGDADILLKWMNSLDIMSDMKLDEKAPKFVPNKTLIL